MTKLDPQKNDKLKEDNNLTSDANEKDREKGSPSETPQLGKKRQKWAPYALAVPVTQMIEVDEKRTPTYIKSKDKNNPYYTEGVPIPLQSGWWGIFMHRGFDDVSYNSCHRYVFSLFILVDSDHKITVTDNTDVPPAVLNHAYLNFNLILKELPFMIKGRRPDGPVILSSAVERDYDMFLDRTLAKILVEAATDLNSEAANKSLIQKFGYKTYLSRSIDEYLMTAKTDERHLIAAVTLISIGAPFVAEYIEENFNIFSLGDLNFLKSLVNSCKFTPFTYNFTQLLPKLRRKKQ